MNKIFKLIKSNIRKDAKQTISFFFIIIFASALLYIGFITARGYQSLWETKTKEYDTPHILSVVESKDTNAINECLDNVTGVAEYSYTDMIHTVITNEVRGDDNIGDILFQPYSNFGVCDNPGMVELSENTYKNAIYLPIVCKYYWDSELDTEFKCTIGEEEYTFMVAGFFERMMTGGNGVYRYSMFVNDEDYERISANPISHNNTAYFIKLDENEDDAKISVRITKEFGKKEITTFNILKSDAEFARMHLPDILSSVMIAFSLIAVVITLLVINFRISNSIEQDIKNIGVQKAIGYTSFQIRLAIILQFALVTAAASAIGISLTYLFLPTWEQIIRTEALCIWEYGIDWFCVTATAGLLTFAAIAVSFFSTRRINKLQPVTALRQGLNVHNFRKNHFSLDKSKGSLGILLPFKAILHWSKQSVLLMVMMIAIGFTTAFVIAFGYNVIFDDSRMMRLLSSNHENATVFITDDDIIPEIAAMDEVEKVYRYNSEMAAAIGDYQVILESADDYSDFSFDGIYEGRAPKYDNEIVISGNIKKHLKVELGEEIEVSCGAYTEKFLIVGLTQTTSSMGWGCYITEEARINRLHIPLNYTHLCVDLKGGIGSGYADSTDEFITKLKDKYKEKITGAINVDFTLYEDNSLLAMMQGIVFVFAVLILLFVTLIINLIIKTVTVRRQHEFGIQKAIGFTSRQIRGQLGIETMSVSVIGNIIGAILGCYFTNKIVSLIFSRFGVMKADFLVPVSVGIISVIGLAVFIYAITYLVSGNIRKISAYKLISE